MSELKLRPPKRARCVRRILHSAENRSRALTAFGMEVAGWRGNSCGMARKGAPHPSGAPQRKRISIAVDRRGTVLPVVTRTQKLVSAGRCDLRLFSFSQLMRERLRSTFPGGVPIRVSSVGERCDPTPTFPPFRRARAWPSVLRGRDARKRGASAGEDVRRGVRPSDARR